MTMTSLVVSMTFIILPLAANQLGPRLVTNFLAVRLLQVALGLFIGTILYLLVVLGSLDEARGSTGVPRLAVTVDGILTVLCLFALLFQPKVTKSSHLRKATFTHHTPSPPHGKCPSELMETTAMIYHDPASHEAPRDGRLRKTEPPSWVRWRWRPSPGRSEAPFRPPWHRHRKRPLLRPRRSLHSPMRSSG
jgi:hypothetical protein